VRTAILVEHERCVANDDGNEQPQKKTMLWFSRRRLWIISFWLVAVYVAHVEILANERGQRNKHVWPLLIFYSIDIRKVYLI
jgi:hypothetical protein